jgi:hypothetical protein
LENFLSDSYQQMSVKSAYISRDEKKEKIRLNTEQVKELLLNLDYIKKGLKNI